MASKTKIINKIPKYCLECGSIELIVTIGNRIWVKCRKCQFMFRVLREHDTIPDLHILKKQAEEPITE